MPTVTFDIGAGGVLGVVLRGEVDFTNAALVLEAFRAAMTGLRPALIRVDMSDVTFLDSSGIGVLVRMMRTAGELGAAYRVQRTEPKVYDQLQAAGLLEAFGIAQAPTATDDRVG